jgi:hypothetical protein
MPTRAPHCGKGPTASPWGSSRRAAISGATLGGEDPFDAGSDETRRWGLALNFEAGRTQVHQILAMRSEGGRSGLPLRRGWYGDALRHSGEAGVRDTCTMVRTVPSR